MIPDYSRILRQDLPGAPNWVDNLLSKINTYFEQTYIIWNGGITFQNLRAAMVTSQFSTPANYSSGVNKNFTPFTFPISFQGASSVVISSCNVNTNNYNVGNTPLTIPAGGWREAAPGKVTVSYMTGLAASTSYIAVFQVF
jgi:hypothetical protein